MMCVFNMIKPNTDICFATQMRRKLQICIYVSDMQPQSLGSVWYLAVTQSAPTCLPSAVLQPNIWISISQEGFYQTALCWAASAGCLIVSFQLRPFFFFRGLIMPTQPAQRGGVPTLSNPGCVWIFYKPGLNPEPDWTQAWSFCPIFIHPHTSPARTGACWPVIRLY